MVELHDNLYVQAETAGGEWEAHEASRLQNMDQFLTTVATADLVPAIQTAGQTVSEDRRVRLLDIGAGTGTITEDLVTAEGAEYWALDANQSFLDARETPEDRKVLGRSEDLPFPDGEFDVTFSRAVTAWNTDPKKAIAEQLRVTRLGGVAVFTEFDWEESGADLHSDAGPAAMAARAIMMRTLTGVGFRPGYGFQLGADIDEAAASNDLHIVRQEVKHMLPAGDHRGLFLETAENIRKQLEQAGAIMPQARLMASLLGGHMYKIQHAESVNLRLPTLVTQTVHKTA